MMLKGTRSFKLRSLKVGFYGRGDFHQNFLELLRDGSIPLAERSKAAWKYLKTAKRRKAGAGTVAFSIPEAENTRKGLKLNYAQCTELLLTLGSASYHAKNPRKWLIRRAGDTWLFGGWNNGWARQHWKAKSIIFSNKIIEAVNKLRWVAMRLLTDDVYKKKGKIFFKSLNRFSKVLKADLERLRNMRHPPPGLEWL